LEPFFRLSIKVQALIPEFMELADRWQQEAPRFAFRSPVEFNLNQEGG